MRVENQAGDGTVAYWKHIHDKEPILVYSTILGVAGLFFAWVGPMIKPLER
jgi:hypothetical protein